MPGAITPLRFGLLLAALFVVSHPGIVFGTQTFFHRDYGVLGYPFLHYHRECFWQGELPLWNPLSNCGVPFLAQWGTMTLYPFSLFYLLLPMPWSVGVFSLGHLWLGGLGMFFLARRWTGNGLGPALAGLAFAFGGIAQASLMWPNYTVALGWMPWIVLLAERAWREGGRLIVAAAAVGALQMLSGVPEIILMTWLVAALVLVGSRVTAPKLTSPTFPLLPVGRFAAVVALVAGLSAAQLLPFFELLELSQRQAGNSATKWAMPVWGWGNLLLPVLHYFRTPQGTFVQEGQNFFGTYYPGIAVLALAGLGACVAASRRAWLLAALAVGGLVLAMGEAFPPNRWMQELLPLTGFARYPVKFVVLTAFALPLLAAFSVQALIRTDDELTSQRKIARETVILAGFGVTLGLLLIVWVIAAKFRWPYDQWPLTRQCAVGRAVALIITGFLVWLLTQELNQRRRLLLGGILLLAIWGDLRTHLPRVNPTLPAEVMEPGWSVRQAGFAGNVTPGQGRVFISPTAEAQLLRSEVTDLGADFLGKRLALWSNLNVLDGVAKMNGSSTLRVWQQDQVQEWLYSSPTNVPPRLLDFLGVTYETSPTNVVEWVSRPSSLPLVTAGQRVLQLSPQETKARMLSPDFDPQREVIISLMPGTRLADTGVVAADVKVTRFERHRIDLEVNVESAANGAYVVLAQTWHPAWQATANGQRTMVMPANHAFQAIVVPPGKSQVALTYRDQDFRTGVGITLATMGICGLLIIRVRRRQPVKVEPG